MRLSDSMLGAVFLVAGIALGWYSYELPSIPGQNYGASTFPLMIALGMIACSARLIYVGLRSGGEPSLFLSENLRNPRSLAAALTTILLIVFYILFSKGLGFIPTAFLVTFCMFLILRVSLLKAIVLAIVASLACDFIFRTLLLVPLPSGIMPRLPW